MLFATNRTPKGSSRTKVNRKIAFDRQVTRPGSDMYFCERLGKNDYREVGSKTFFQRLKELDSDTQILLYIHGFNNNMEPEIFERAEDLQRLINQGKNKKLALVVPLIWPCDDDPIISVLDDYWDDQKAADFSANAFSRMLSKFDTWRKAEAARPDPCMRRINLLAHSMGNRVLRNAIHYWGRNDHAGMVPLLFRNVFMVAADVVNHCLEPGRSGALLPRVTRNLVVYFANDDLAMPASKVANLKNRQLSKRLGMTGIEELGKVPRNVYEVDCDNFNNTFDKPKGHSYFTEVKGVISPALQHMMEAMDGGRVQPAFRTHVLDNPFKKQ